MFPYAALSVSHRRGERWGEREREGVWNVGGYVTTANGFPFDVGGRYPTR